MNTQLRIGITGILFVLVFVFGFWLSRVGKPYNGLVFTLHKLISLGAILFLGLTIQRAQQGAPLSAAQIAVIALTAALFVATMATGGILSAMAEPPEMARQIHKVTPYLTALSTGGLLVQLVMKAGELARI